ncbi:hypothetical protein ACFE04_002140 [Oxalis oulophora]
MVSLRRHRLLALCSGKSSVFPFPDFGIAAPPENPNANLSVEKPVAKVFPGSSNVSGCGSSKDQQNQSSSGVPIKRRKRHRRKQIQNQETCLMRGVYFKNMKWQAAIKVDKKQIHLGTVGSQEAAARLYDRAAFMIGREPNFEISEEEKQELRKFKWDEFLAFTRRGINDKKYKRRLGAGLEKRSEQDGEWESKQRVNSASEDVGPESRGRHSLESSN